MKFLGRIFDKDAKEITPIPVSGTVGEVLRKTSNTDFAVEWDSPVLYGTGTPPSPVGLLNGTLYIQYT